MRLTRGLVAVLALALPVLAVPPAHAAPTPAKVVAAAPYPGHGEAETAVTGDGTTLVVYNSAGLTTFTVGPHQVARRGTTTVNRSHEFAELLLHPGSRFAYLVNEVPDRPAAVKVYDLAGRAPRLVRTVGFASAIPERKNRVFYDATLTHDGSRLLLLGPGFVQVLGLGRPARPHVGQRFAVDRAYDFTVTPDGKHLVVGGSNDDEGVRLTRYALAANGAPELELSASLVVPGWEDRTDRTWVSKLVPGAGGGSVLVQLGSYYDEGGDSAQEMTAIARVRIGDLGLAAATVPDDGAEQLFLEDLSGGGGRVYLRSGYTTDEPEIRPRSALWTDAATLRARHALGGLGDVRSLSFSTAGPSRGRLFAAVVRNGRHLVLEVNP